MAFAPQYIVIHTVGAADKNGRPIVSDPTAESIRRYHVDTLGWRDIGYAAVVRMSGEIEQGRPEIQVGSHVEGFNSLSLGVVFCGHGDLIDFTPAQWESGPRYVAAMLRRHGLEAAFRANPMRVLGHRETAQLVPAVFPGPKTTKTCPGTKIDMRRFRLRVLEELNRK